MIIVMTSIQIIHCCKQTFKQIMPMKLTTQQTNDANEVNNTTQMMPMKLTTQHTNAS